VNRNREFEREETQSRSVLTISSALFGICITLGLAKPTRLRRSHSLGRVRAQNPAYTLAIIGTRAITVMTTISPWFTLAYPFARSLQISLSISLSTLRGVGLVLSLSSHSRRHSYLNSHSNIDTDTNSRRDYDDSTPSLFPIQTRIRSNLVHTRV
jgi:hypothetical protein